VLLIDTGMLSSYYPGGHASALEIRDDAKFTAEYMEEAVVLIAPPAVALGDGDGGSVRAEDSTCSRDFRQPTIPPVAAAGCFTIATSPIAIELR
jgi:hypothetical protein